MLQILAISYVSVSYGQCYYPHYYFLSDRDETLEKPEQPRRAGMGLDPKLNWNVVSCGS